VTGARKQASAVQPRKQPIADDVQARIIEMYNAGAKTAEITRATHVPRASIYWVLERNGIRPNRVGLGRSTDAMTISEVLDRLRSVERENGELRAECERLRATLDTIWERLGLNGQAAAKALGVPRVTRKGSSA
jgi:'Paired box' domain